MDSDEREGCRSLVCDIEGIIVAEMVYRCMVCQQVSNSTSEAREHYHQLHMQDDDDDGDEEIDDVDDIDLIRKFHHHHHNIRNNNDNSNSRANTINNSNRNNNNNLMITEENENETDEIDDEYFHYYTNVLSNYVNNFNDEQQQQQHQQTFDDTSHYGLDEINSTAHIGNNNNNNNKNGNNNNTPNDASLTSSKLVRRNFTNSGNRGNNINNNGNVESCTRSGYITCPVCTSTRYYTTLQRRYGQFTCVACYRFFKEFFTSPRQYVCSNLGSCSLNVKSRCKACWLHSCLNTYTIDSKRRIILETYKPVSFIHSDTPISLSPTGCLASTNTANTSGRGSNSSSGGGGGGCLNKSGVGVGRNSSANGMVKNVCIESASNEIVDEKMDYVDTKVERIDEINVSNNESKETIVNNNNINKNKYTITNDDLNDNSSENLKNDESIINQDSFDELSDNGEQLIIEEGPLNSSQDSMQNNETTSTAGTTVIDEDEDDDEDDDNDNVSNTNINNNNNNNDENNLNEKFRKNKERSTKTRVKNWCCLQCDNCLADDCGQCINCLDRPKFGGRFVRKQRCINRKCLRKSSK